MSRLRIYGIARTRAFRALWIAKELGLDHEHVPLEIGEEGARKAEYLAINPNGRLPAIEDVTDPGERPVAAHKRPVYTERPAPRGRPAPEDRDYSNAARQRGAFPGNGQ